MFKIREEEIVEQWGILLAGGEGKAEEIFENTVKNLEESGAPDLEISKKEVTPSFIKGLMGKKKTFLTVSNTYLKDYRMYIGARKYGRQLNVSWYLTLQPRGIMAWVANHISDNDIVLIIAFVILLPFIILQSVLDVVLMFRRGAPSVSPADLDIFDLEELSAYTTTCHHALLEAVAELMRKQGQNPSTIDRKSKGFLSIS